jgi:hypothetical protein
MGILDSVLNLVPVIDINYDPTGSLAAINQLIQNVGCIVPTTSFFIICASWLVLAQADLFLSILTWVLKKIPFISG